jgi:hypothetical protein
MQLQVAQQQRLRPLTGLQDSRYTKSQQRLTTSQERGAMIEEFLTRQQLFEQRKHERNCNNVALYSEAAVCTFEPQINATSSLLANMQHMYSTEQQTNLHHNHINDSEKSSSFAP